MKKMLAIARWEYIEKVKSKAFLIGLLVTPLLMAGMGFLPMLFVSQEDKNTKRIGIVDESGEVAAAFSQRMGGYTLADGRPNFSVRVIGSGADVNDDTFKRANRMVVEDEIEGYVVIGETLSAGNILCEYRSKAGGDVWVGSRAEETLRQLVTERRVIALGLDTRLLKELDVKVDLRTVKVSQTGEKEEAGFMKVFFSSFAFMMMMFFLIATSGQLLVRSVIEEKSNRIIEVLVSSCTPTELMAGKVLGLSGLGFTQLGFWGLIGLAITFQTGTAIITPGNALLLVVYFILGYLFYSAIFIAAGSALNTEQEAQQVNSYLIILLVIPIMLALPAMKDPNAVWLRVLTFIPVFTPTMMALRIPIQSPAGWEIASTIGLMILAIYGAMVVAGRIFRIGILATGKTPGIAVLVRWVRTG